MKKTRLTFKMFICLAMMSLAGVLGASAYDFPDYEHDMYFNYLDDGTVEVTFYDESYNSYSGAVTIPSVAVRGAINQTMFDVTRIGQYAFRNCSDLTSVSIPTSITSIGRSAFMFCTKLTQVTIPYSVKTISYNAFGDCSALKTVYIGSGVTTIGAYAFDSPLNNVYCYALTPPTIESENAFKASTYSDGTLYVKNPRTRYKYYSSSAWRKFSNISVIDLYDFMYNNMYFSIDINTSNYTETGKCGVSPRSTGYNSYSNIYYSIPSVAYTNGTGYTVTMIEAYAFYDCTGIETVKIPSSVTWIKNNSFQNCSNLKTLDIGDGCTSISYAAFYGCSSLNSITCRATTPPNIIQGALAFDYNTATNATLYVPAGSIDAYKNATDWKRFTNIKPIPGTYLEINATNFPDANFRNYLLSLFPAGYITNEEIAALTELNLQNRSISNLTGIKYFTALQKLYCYNNPLTSLDVSGLTSLTYLDCAPTDSYTGTKLTSLKVSGCSNLETLLCYNTNISTLSVSDCSKLKKLNCHNCPYLTTLLVVDKSNLYSLDCANCTSLATLTCYRNALTTLNVTGNTALTQLRCYENADLATVTGLADCKAITYLDCEDCKIANLDAVNSMTNIQTLYARNNKLTSLTVANKSKLNYVRVLGNTLLTELKCYTDALTYLDVSGCTALQTLMCYENPNLTGITGLADCSNLVNLYANSCSLTTLNLANKTKLTTAVCYSNQLTSLNVSGCTVLTTLFIYKNNISGSGMTTLVNSLPMRSASSKGTLRALSNSGENNTMTAAQVSTARSKNWLPKQWNGSAWVDMTALMVGDVNGDGQVNISDVTELIGLVLNGEPSVSVYPAADVNGDGAINISDVTELIATVLNA